MVIVPGERIDRVEHLSCQYGHFTYHFCGEKCSGSDSLSVGQSRN